MRKRNIFQYIEMMIFCNDKFCIGCNSTIHKFIVVQISLNEIPLIRRGYLPDILSFHNSVNDIPCHINTYIASYNLSIFLQNLI